MLQKDMEIKVLSLHFINKCNLNCDFCYISKESLQLIPREDLLEFPRICKELSIDQIALGGGEPSLYSNLVWELAEESNKHNIVLNVTSNGKYLDTNCLDLDIFPYELLGEIAFSIDTFKLSQIRNKNNWLENIKNIKMAFNSCKVGYNILLDWLIMEKLIELVSYLSGSFDYINLLQPKNMSNNIDFITIQSLAILLGESLLVDESIKLAMGESEYCSRGREIVSIHPDMSVRPCSFSDPIATLERAEDLPSILDKYYPLLPTRRCPYTLP